MSLKALSQTIGNYGRDARLNLGSVLSLEGAPGLTINQIRGIALATSYAVKSKPLVVALLEDFAGSLSEPEKEAAKAAASIMAMNNIYYRFLHLCDDKQFNKLPARLRMNVIASPGIPKVDFELFALAVSALSGCGMCINAHVNQALKQGISAEGVQSAVRIAAVINAVAQSVFIEDTGQRV